MKKLVLAAALLNCGVAWSFTEPGAAIPVSAAAGGSAPAASEAEQQVVVVEAWRRDRALDAFLRGDFATAEVEFQKNVRCIRRVALEQDAAIREGLAEVDRATVPRTPYSNTPTIHGLPLRPEQIAERTCHSKPWQLYMIGLSQIQLGRFAEAKKSLYTVIWMSKEDLMFDAHYRVGLLELLDGNVENANRRLAHLTRMQRSCQSRGSRCEVNADLDAATRYLAHAVTAARQGTSH